MPGAILLGDHAQDLAVLGDQIVAGDAAVGIAQPRDRRFGVAHAGIMEDDHRDAGIARVEIGRRGCR